MSAVERTQARAEIAGNIFADGLRRFVADWAPDHPQDRFEFQLALTRLFVDAMQNQAAHLHLCIETNASAMFDQAATRPLYVIMEKPTTSPPKENQ